jgi:hypothetical protein
MISQAIDKNGTPYGWYCHSSKHLWISRADAEKCCDGIHVRILQTVRFNPYWASFTWAIREEQTCH